MTMKIKMKTTNEILIINVEYNLHNMIFGTDQYGRYLRIRKSDFYIIK